jgi:hypothetical protein
VLECSLLAFNQHFLLCLLSDEHLHLPLISVNCICSSVKDLLLDSGIQNHLQTDKWFYLALDTALGLEWQA